jgi:hypothetical protein
MASEINLHDAVVKLIIQQDECQVITVVCENWDPSSLVKYNLTFNDVLYFEQTMYEVFGQGMNINSLFFMDATRLLDRVATIKRDLPHNALQGKYLPDLPLIAPVIEFNSGDQLQVLCTSVVVETSPLRD